MRLRGKAEFRLDDGSQKRRPGNAGEVPDAVDAERRAGKRGYVAFWKIQIFEPQADDFL